MTKWGFRTALMALLLLIASVDVTARKLDLVVHLKAIGENERRKIWSPSI